MSAELLQSRLPAVVVGIVVVGDINCLSFCSITFELFTTKTSNFAHFMHLLRKHIAVDLYNNIVRITYLVALFYLCT